MVAALAEKLVLGTAQFGLSYGINNVHGQPSLGTVADILAEAHQANVTWLDTAAAYGDSESRLGTLLAGQPAQPFSIVTKLAAGSATAVAEQLTQALARLRQPAVYGVLFHDFAGQQQQPAAWEALQAARAAGLTSRIGVSLYHPWQVEWLLDRNLPFDLVQVPFNVLDQRFRQWLPLLEQRGVEVHVRSAFLQGLLLRDPASLPPFFHALRPKLERLAALAEHHAVPLAALLLLFVAYTPGVAKAVIGVDTVANLHANLAAGQYRAAYEQLLPELRSFAESDDTSILPYTWPQR